MDTHRLATTVTIRRSTYVLARTAANRVAITNSRGESAGWAQTLSNGRTVLVGAPRAWNGREYAEVVAAAKAA